MKTLFVNMAWDCAGVSIQQVHAINKYTDWKARHFRACPTFNYPTDMAGERYNKDELISVIEESDIIHFCQYPHTDTQYFNFGFDWNELIKNKIKVIHDYALFGEYGYWKISSIIKRFWDKKKQLGYNDIWSSSPLGLYIYNDCYYMPDIVDETDEKYNYEKDFSKVVIGHFPTGGGNRKNTEELVCASTQFNKNVELIIKRGCPNSEILSIKKNTNLGFDAISRGFHGMTTNENLAMGVPTMVNIDREFIPIFNECFQTDFFPFEQVKTIDEIIRTVNTYSNNLSLLQQRSIEVKNFIITIWNAKNIAHRIIKRYEQLL